MLIREYQPDDLAALRAIHAAQGFDYVLPDLSNPLFVTKLVLLDSSGGDRDSSDVGPGLTAASSAQSRCELSADATCGDDDGAESRGGGGGGGMRHDAHATILGAALLRLTAEAYLLLDPRAGTPRQRWQSLLALHEAARRDAWLRGLEDVHAWLPPPIARTFGRRLERLGWLRDAAWTPYCKKLGS